MSKVPTILLAAAVATALTGTAMAQGQATGPVARACATDITKFCATLSHGDAEVRSCLEQHRQQVSAACRKALDTTGGGRGRNRAR